MQADYHAPLCILELSGVDAETFLQNQLTQDVASIKTGQWMFSGHCDAKGKLWSLLRVWRTDEAFYLLTNPQAAQASLTQMQKFSVFSKVDIKDLTDSTSIHFHPSTALAMGRVEFGHNDNAPGPIHRLGLGGASLQLSFEQPQAAQQDPLTKAQPEHSETAAPTTKGATSVQDIAPWLQHEIEHGVPQLTAASIGEYVPQMLGLDRLGGINFKKGCYIGQETVARMHYLGQNKRTLRLIVGTSAQVPAPGDTLEQKLGDNWRRAGAVINAVRYDNNEVAILAVVPADLGEDVAIRIKGDEQSQMTLRPKFDNQENFQ